MSVQEEVSGGLSSAPMARAMKKLNWISDPSFLVLAAVFVGIALGYWTPDVAVLFKPLGDVFLRLVKMAIGPIIFLTIVTGISKMGDLRRVGRVGGMALIYFEVITTIAMIFGLVLANLIKPGAGLNAAATGEMSAQVAKSAAAANQEHSLVDFFVAIAPDNIFKAFADGNLIQIVFFSLLFGITLAMVGPPGKPVEDLLEKLSTVFLKVIEIIMKFAALGAFGAMAFTVGKFGFGAVSKIGYFIIATNVIYIVFIVLVLGTVTRMVGMSLWRLFNYVREEVFIAYATHSSEAVLTPTMNKLEKLGCDRAVVGLVFPTGYSFNLDGAALYLSIAVMFIAQAYNVDLTLWQQIQILIVLIVTSKGGAGITGAAFVVLASTISATNVLPVEGLGLLFGIDRLVGRAHVNLMGNVVATVVVARWDGAFDKATALDTYRKFFKKPELNSL
jgi:aerobic C4-dicarboxylate transport protein